MSQTEGDVEQDALEAHQNRFLVQVEGNEHRRLRATRSTSSKVRICSLMTSYLTIFQQTQRRGGGEKDFDSCWEGRGVHSSDHATLVLILQIRESIRSPERPL